MKPPGLERISVSWVSESTIGLEHTDGPECGWAEAPVGEFLDFCRCDDRDGKRDTRISNTPPPPPPHPPKSPRASKKALLSTNPFMDTCEGLPHLPHCLLR